MSRTLYVVYGSTGEYSDRREWPVRAFLDETKAQTLVTLAEARARELMAARETSGDRYGLRSEEVNEHDPTGHDMDYTGTTYYICDVELDDDVLLSIAETVTADVAAGRIRRALDLEERPS